ncbi:hypothetical protein FQN49_004599 [Arthroderma sp. PD_2]|nr:hypothetical protein FQN49_004599 [Arthroderma sp. PD_2]
MWTTLPDGDQLYAPFSILLEWLRHNTNHSGEFFIGPIDLSAAVDVYSDWVDACDAVAKEGTKEGASASVARADPEGSSAQAAPAVADEVLDDDY